MRRFSVILLWVMFALVGCEKIEVREQAFIIEGSLFAGEPVDDIFIKEQTPVTEPDSLEFPITNASIVITKENVDYPLQYTDGVYKYIGSDLAVNSGDLFDIEVTVGSRTATAQTVVPPVTEGLTLSDDKMVIPPIEFNTGLLNQLNELFFNVRLKTKWDNDNDDLHFVVVEFADDEFDSLFPEGFPQEGIDFLSSFRFIPEATRVDTFDIIGLSFESYGRHKATVYRVNQEYSDLFDNQEQDSRDLTEPPSNVVGGFGIFTAFAADSVFFEIVRE